MAAKNNTLKVNKMAEPPIPPPEPIYRFEVAMFFKDSEGVSAGVDLIDVFACFGISDSEELNFFIWEDGQEVLVASFKEWTYFIRKESELENAAILWGKEFESLAHKHGEDDVPKVTPEDYDGQPA